MGAFVTQRAVHSSGNSYISMKQDLISQAKHRAHAMGANAIVECKMAISRGDYYDRYYFTLLFSIILIVEKRPYHIDV